MNEGEAKNTDGRDTGNCNWEKEGIEVGQLMNQKYKGAITPESDALAAEMNKALNAVVTGDIPKACGI